MKHKFSFMIFTGALLFAVMASMAASAMIVPQPLATDPRIKVVAWAPNEIMKYTGFYRVQTSWELAPDEYVMTIAMGDTSAWLINPLGNRVFIKPVEHDATTNMTMITNKRVYLVELHCACDEDNKGVEKGADSKDVTWVLRFVYPGDDEGFASSGHMDPVPDLETEDLTKFNFRYTVSGSEIITPLRVFDDGEFTYFEFRDKNGEIPAFYMVDNQNNEAMINYRTRGNYIVVERVVPRFTLRHGNDVVCVFNEAMSVRRNAGSTNSTTSNGSSESSSSSSWFK